MQIKKIYSVTEIANMLDVTSQCIRNHIHSGYLKASQTMKSGSFKITHQALKTFLKLRLQKKLSKEKQAAKKIKLAKKEKKPNLIKKIKNKFRTRV